MESSELPSDTKFEGVTSLRDDVNSDDEEDSFFKWRPRRYVHLSDSDSDEDDDVTLKSKCGDVIAKHNDEGYVMETAMMPDDVDVDELLSRPRRRLGRLRIGPLYEAPEFVQRLNAFEDADAGSTVTFECTYKALPKPVIKWYKDDEEITENSRFELEWMPETSVVKLIIHKAAKKDEGAYKCKAENQEGVASTTGYLSVKGDLTDKPLSSQPRKCKSEHTVSFPPHLRTIVEQQSVEEREAVVQSSQAESPIQDFIDNFRREKTWPFTSMGYTQKDADQESNSSDTSVDSQDFDLVRFSADHNEDDIIDDRKQHQDEEEADTQQGALFIDEDKICTQQEVPNHVTPVMNKMNNITEARVPPYNSNASAMTNCTSEANDASTEYIINSIAPSGVNTGAHGSNKLYVRPLSNSEHTTPPSEHEQTQSIGKKKPASVPAPRREIMDWSRALDVLDTPCLYFMPVAVSAALLAVATEANPLYLVLFMVVVSLVGFRLMGQRKNAT